MPSSSEHREKAERNRRLLDTLDHSAAPEWAATIAFYSALHLVERLSACESIHHSLHQDRAAYLHKNKKHRSIHASFLSLFDASLVARYGTVNQFAKAFPGDTVKRQLIDKHLVGIESHVSNHFAPS